MRPTPKHLAWLAAALAAAFTGCQGPAAPTAPAAAAKTPSTPEIPLADLPPATGLQAAFGVWQGTVTPDGVKLTPVALRAGQLVGDSYAVDATEFFTQSPCTDCLQITGYGFQGGALELDVTIRHPFPDQNVRTDLDVFDPRLILNTPLHDDLGPTTFPATPGYTPGPGLPPETLRANTRLLLNADGYTTHFDRRVNELLGVNWAGNLHPYKDYAEDYDPGPGVLPIPNHRLSQFALPETQRFQINVPPTGTLNFAFVLEANYGQSSTRATRRTPTYFLPEFNRKEAYDVRATFPSGPVISRRYGSSLGMTVEVRDWQAPATVDPTYPNQGNTGGLKQVSTVERVEIEAPTIQTGLTTVLSPFVGTGAETDPFIYNVTIDRTRNVPPPPGPAPVLITAVDTLHGTELSLDPDVDDLGYTSDARAYQIIHVDVEAVGQFEELSPAYNQLDINLTRGLPVYAGGPQPGADIAVFNSGAVSGVYLADSDNDVVRYPLFYGAEDGGTPAAALATNGVLPFDDFGGTTPHPAPSAFMPIAHLDAADDGSLILSFADPNFTFSASRLAGLGLTVELANDAQVVFFQHDGTRLLAKPRYVSGCGSAGAPGAPAYGDRALNVAEGASNYSSYRSPLGWISGGPATEGCGDALTWFLYNTPYTNASQRIFNGDVPLGVLPGTAAGDWAKLVAWDLGSVDRSATPASQYMYTVNADGLLVVLDVLAGINEDRSSDPVIQFSTNVALAGWEIRDLQVLEFDAANPRQANSFTQTGDWIAVLYNNTDTTAPGGILRIYEIDPSGTTLNVVQELSGGPGVPYGPLAGTEVSNLDVDDRNYAIHITHDDNGNAVDGGRILVTVLGLL